MIVESNCMSKVLNSPVLLDRLLKEVVLAYNNAGTFAKRIQILSLVATKLSFQFLKSLNSKDASSQDIGEKAAKEDDADDADEDFHGDQVAWANQCFFNPPVSYHIYRKARLHYNDNGHGLSPVVRARSYIWKVPLPVVDAIIDFVSSPLNTQNVSLFFCIHLKVFLSAHLLTILCVFFRWLMGLCVSKIHALRSLTVLPASYASIPKQNWSSNWRNS